ncbi:putative cytochrome P450 E-class, group IV [Triangularia verruculosa]|uniref:Cytochrome P450 E-class, group IV n=1 Tax=Triangularia verruculosa TaxID=2587418 RepID=A0AAN6XEJ0_9PEZI|nr:putative cytochrome P450 E-class, group IV [Triangularia verruculosa]
MGTMATSTAGFLNTLMGPDTYSLFYLLALLFGAIFLRDAVRNRRLSHLPHLNPKPLTDLTKTRIRKQFFTTSYTIIRQWFRANPDKPARITADVGEVIILPARLANEVKNDSRLSFGAFIYNSFHADLPGFEGFREGARDSRIVQAVIVRDLTKHLNKVTEPLAEETRLALDELFPITAGTETWRSVDIRDTILHLIARISSRVFLGGELCRDDDWLKVTRDYTVDAFRAAVELRFVPKPVRFLAHWWMPSCQKARAHVKEARRIIGPVLEQRRALKKAGTDTFDDAIEWFEREAQGRPYDPVTAQLVLSMAAIHTTTDLTVQVLSDLVQHPELIDALREEITSALREGGWTKNSLYNMKLLDSVIKESQRIKPIGLVSMRRVASSSLTLSDGTYIPKGATIAVSAERMWDPAVYPGGESWDGRRFLKMRSVPGSEHVAQLVSTSPEHLGFGHGEHACPGRFFAGNEVKIALLHLLLRYDWRLPEGAVAPKAKTLGLSLAVDPSMRLEYRVRNRNLGELGDLEV